MVTGKSEKQQVIAFIDYENCSNLTEIALNIYTELIIFAGAKQNNVALPVNAFPEAVKVTLRHVSEVSRNNVDFHLVLELGQCVCHYGPEKEYHIVSADKGYDGIVWTLQARGICCRRVSPDKASSVKMAAPDMDIVIRWANKIQQAAREVRNMPVTEETFNNYLKSQMRGEWRDVLTRGIRDELVRRGVMKIQGNKIIW
ncbi:PIN domain-containing protein [Escherichia coli]|uniref:PIN domain-containing protein n=1 Tax=Escherichia coli TaxID=562 RepID=UPI0031330028